MKKIIHVYKKDWSNYNLKPGFGDFVRGTCHLLEKYKNDNLEVLVDISKTDYSNFILPSNLLYAGGIDDNINAHYFINNEAALFDKLDVFCESQDEEIIFVCTNFGHWHRTILPSNVKEIIKNLYCFQDGIEARTIEAIGHSRYATLTIRCGDEFFNSADHGVFLTDKFSKVYELIETQILPYSNLPIVVTSDSYELKLFLAEKYNFIVLPHKPQHGAFGNVLPVVTDLCMLKNSSQNYFINNWSEWWSGFVHYTSIIFNIPELNFRFPLFERETIDENGKKTRVKI
jgi:hypothetical protein